MNRGSYEYEVYQEECRRLDEVEAQIEQYYFEQEMASNPLAAFEANEQAQADLDAYNEMRAEVEGIEVPF